MTDRIGKPPVEGLSEVAWARVERGVLARLDSASASATPASDVARARRTWRWIALPVAAAAVIAAVIVLTRAPAPPRVADIAPSRVVAGDAPSSVTFGNANVVLDANSAVALQGDADHPAVLLERGAAWFSVAPRNGRPPFVVLAGDTTVRVIGTRFRVARDGERADVAVEHGVVEVQFRGGIARVAAGQSWSSLAPAEVVQAAEPAAPQPPSSPAPAAPVAPTRHALHPAATPDTDQQRYEALAQLEVRQPDVAIKGYLELSQGSGKWAALALYSAGRLAVDRKDPRAEMLLGVYLRRFPGGANVADVKYLLDRLQGAKP